jgi:hypothetical protein
MSLQLNGTTGIVLPTAAAPAFSAYMSATQTISTSTWTKVIFNTEYFDTNSNYDPTTNYRFTPTVAGYYQVNLVLAMADTVSGSSTEYSAIYKNGAVYSQTRSRDGVGQPVNVSQSIIISMNGTTDYIEIYAQQIGGTSAQIFGAINQSSFSALMIRSA